MKNKMKLSYKIALIIGILISITYAGPALSVFHSITSDPTGWQLGISISSTIVWFATVTLGYGYLLLQNILAFFGLFFAAKSKRKAFWLLVAPGFVGILLGTLWLGLFIAYEVEWPASWPLPTIMIIVPLAAFIIGKRLRKQWK